MYARPGRTLAFSLRVCSIIFYYVPQITEIFLYKMPKIGKYVKIFSSE